LSIALLFVFETKLDKHHAEDTALGIFELFLCAIKLGNKLGHVVFEYQLALLFYALHKIKNLARRLLSNRVKVTDPKLGVFRV
jgi:hypothetical protein